jgi:hypothetical protein
MKISTLCFLAGVAVLPAVASAQWSDGFEAYADLSNLHGQGGWKGFDNDPAHAGTVSTLFAHSGTKSARISTTSPTVYGDDLTHEYSGYTSGQWTYNAWQYIPGNTPAGTNRNTYFILMNTYADGGAVPGGVDRWSVQLKFNLDPASAHPNTVFDDVLAAAGSPGTAFVPLVFDAWTPISVAIDLNANTMVATYNGLTVISTTWTRGTAGANLAIAAVDLYANGTGPVFYDDLELVPAPSSMGLLALGGLLAARRRRA